MAELILDAFVLGSRTITGVLSDAILTEGVSAAGVNQGFEDRLAGINALSIVARFVYGSTGTSVIVTVDTALGSGGVWIPIARFDFAQANATKLLVPSRTAIVVAEADLAAPDADSCINLLGDRFRARVTSTGVYSNGTLIEIRAQPHA